MLSVYLLLSAYIVDRIVGDPRWIPHPVVLMGKGIVWLEKAIRRCFTNERQLKLAGLLFPLVFVAGSYGLVRLLLEFFRWFHPWIAWVAEIWLISTTVATKGLANAGLEIYQSLSQGKIEQARKALSMVVGRDTENLDESEISRGAVETVAENIVDAIVSPLFFAAIGGAPLAMAYRAANTLDSMVGYKNEKYQNLGWASAKWDDLLNYIPARIAALLLVAASWMQGWNSKRCWETIRRDARLHPSPNSGFTESGIAGALGIQLGGLNYYQGIPSHRAEMGEALRRIEALDIVRTVSLMKLLSILFIFLCLGGMIAIQSFSLGGKG